jgi:hypothetical protein
LAAHKTKTATRRLVPLFPCLKSHLLTIKEKSGVIIKSFDSNTLSEIGNEVWKNNGGWHRNVLRHSWISYRVAKSGDVDQTAIEAGNSVQKIFSNYRAVMTLDGLPMTKELAGEWFGVTAA